MDGEEGKEQSRGGDGREWRISVGEEGDGGRGRVKVDLI